MPVRDARFVLFVAVLLAVIGFLAYATVSAGGFS
jgi:hypothetical protein